MTFEMHVPLQNPKKNQSYHCPIDTSPPIMFYLAHSPQLIGYTPYGSAIFCSPFNLSYRDKTYHSGLLFRILHVYFLSRHKDPRVHPYRMFARKADAHYADSSRSQYRRDRRYRPSGLWSTPKLNSQSGPKCRSPTGKRCCSIKKMRKMMKTKSS
jgi:hypothetical protein